MRNFLNSYVNVLCNNYEAMGQVRWCVQVSCSIPPNSLSCLCRFMSIFDSSGMTWVSIDLWTCLSYPKWLAWRNRYLSSLKNSPWIMINNSERILRISFLITWKSGQRQRPQRARFEKVGHLNQSFPFGACLLLSFRYSRCRYVDCLFFECLQWRLVPLRIKRWS